MKTRVIIWKQTLSTLVRHILILFLNMLMKSPEISEERPIILTVIQKRNVFIVYSDVLFIYYFVSFIQ